MPNTTRQALRGFMGWLSGQPPPIPDRLWHKVLNGLPFLQSLTPEEQTRLRQLSAAFLTDKEFTGTQGLHINDWMALTIAVQACLPLLH